MAEDMSEILMSRLEMLMEDEDCEWFQNEKASAETRLQSAELASTVPPEDNLTVSNQTSWPSDNLDSAHNLTFLNSTHWPSDTLDSAHNLTSSKQIHWRGETFPLALSSSGSELDKKLPKKSLRNRKAAKGSVLLSKMVEPDSQNRIVGQLTEPGEFFCPLLAVSKYPYRFLNASPKICDKVSQQYFASGKFWDRRWTVHYIYPSPLVSIKPQFLVPSSEVKALLEEINRDLNLHLEFPLRSEQRGFLVKFPADGTPRPRFLGICSSRNNFNAIEYNVPAAAPMTDDQDDRSKESFDTKMMAVTTATKNKTTKRNKEQKKVDRLREMKADCRSLKRAQRYLGLRLRQEKSELDNAKWNAVEQVNHEGEQVSFFCEDIDVEKPVVHPFEKDVLFVCIDIEANELDHSSITEIGISTLDTKELVGSVPSKGGINWLKKIRARHFRISEYKHLVNSKFVNGCPDRFETEFGSSEFIRKDQVEEVVRSFFVPPFTTSIDQHGRCLAPGLSADSQSSGMRSVVFVGHDAKVDIDYLKGVGYDPLKEPNVLEVLDTSRLYRALKHDQQPTGLGGVMGNFGLTAWNLHNAGNDAAYTLQALVAIAFKAAATQPGLHLSSANEEEWKEARAESGDGGEIVKKA